jgi:hypothetical protein
MTKMAFYDLTSAEFANERDRIAAAALDAARRAATERLIAGPAAGAGDASAATEVLVSRDTRDSRYELLSAFEKQWALLVLHLVVEVVTDPSPAVRDARDRGATVADIAATLGITEQGVYSRYADQVVRKPRKRNPR